MTHLVRSFVTFIVLAMMTPVSLAMPIATAPTAVDDLLRSGIETGVECEMGAPLEAAAWDMSVAAAAEARSEGPMGMALVMETMINRTCVNHWAYGGGSMRRVLLHPFAYSVFNADSPVREGILAMMTNRLEGPKDIREAAIAAYPVALAMLRGWRTGLLETSSFSCRHYKTLTVTAKWAKPKPDLVYKRHEFHCNVDGGITAIVPSITRPPKRAAR